MTLRNAHPLRTLALTTALTLALVAPVAAAGSHGSYADWYDKWRDYGNKWKDLKSLLGSGNLTDAKALYDEHFAEAAALHPNAEAAIDQAFTDAESISDPADVNYKVAQQAIDKSLYAVAFTNLESAVTAGDVDAAKDWFGLLETKFTGEQDLPGAKAAFADATEATLADAFATLEVEYRDLITLKVHKETTEAPLLITGDPVTAAVEAAEARYYYLSVASHVNATLGESEAEKLTDALDKLIEATLAEDADATEAEAENVLDVLAHYAVASHDNTLGAAYAEYANLVKTEKNLTAARALYNEHFATVAEAHAPDAHANVLAAFSDAAAALDAGNNAEYNVEAQVLEKSLYEIAFNHGFHELDEGEVDEALTHLRVLAVKFKWDESPGGAALALGRMAAANAADAPLADEARNELYDTFLDKVYEEVEETLFTENWGTPTAHVKAIEGVLYFAPLKADVAAVVDVETADHVAHELEELYEAATAQDLEAAEGAADEIRTLLGSYESKKTGVSGLDAVIVRLQRTLNLVHEEIDEYFDFKAQGDMDAAAKEVEEAKLFLSQAESAVDENRAALEAVDADAVATVEARLTELGEILNAENEFSRVAALVEETNAALDEFKAQGATEPAPEATVTITLGRLMKVDGDRVTVPVSLSGLPGDGVAFQLKVKYDNTVLRADSVDVVLGDVKASDVKHEEGYVVFNGATTAVTDAEEKVADVTFQVLGDNAGLASLEVEVEDLTDAAGKALGVKTVEGTSLDLAGLTANDADVTSEENTETTTDTPGLGLLAAIAALGAVALLGRRRRD